MSDMMTFPDTVEEFMESYKVIDTEHAYSNGVELVPIYRMRQWFEHKQAAQPEIIRCKDCKRRNREGYCTVHTRNIHGFTSAWWTPNDNDFCSLAERRGE